MKMSLLASVLVVCLLLAAVLVAALVWLAPPCALGRCVDGARDVAVAPLNPVPDAPQVVVMGTSLTSRGTWPDALQASLTSCLGRDVTVTRNALGRETSRWGLGQVEALQAASPDLLVIEFTINDADLRRNVSLAESAANHRALIEAARAANPNVRIVLLTLNRGYGMRAMIRPWLRAYVDQYEVLAADLGLGRLDLLPHWDRAVRAEGLATLIPDGVHPTDDAALAINAPPLTAALGAAMGANCASE